MKKVKKSSFECQFCKKSFVGGNYSIHVNPAKRIPLKGHKLLKWKKSQDTLNIESSLRSYKGVSKFRCYLNKRIHGKNAMVITCLNCDQSAEFGMRKNRVISSKNATGKKPKTPKKKKPRLSDKKSESTTDDVPSTLEFCEHQPSPVESPTVSSPYFEKKKDIVLKKQKMKERANLQKALSKIKNKKSRMDTSLQDFLSSF